MSESILQEAQSLVYGERAASYGHPLDNWQRIAAFWTVILGHAVTAEQVGLCMIATKISRQVSRPSRDNMTDAAGYAAAIQDCIEERQRRENLTLLAAQAEPGPVVPIVSPLIQGVPPPIEADE